MHREAACHLKLGGRATAADNILDLKYFMQSVQWRLAVLSLAKEDSMHIGRWISWKLKGTRLVSVKGPQSRLSRFSPSSLQITSREKHIFTNFTKITRFSLYEIKTKSTCTTIEQQRS